MRALRRHGSASSCSPEPVIEGVNVDVSALVLPVVDTEACAVATRIQLVIGGEAVLLAGLLESVLGRNGYSAAHAFLHRQPHLT